MSSISNTLISQATTNTNNQASSTTTSSSSDQLTSKDTFLKLLVAQIKNQDPTNPTDSTQFVGQLTQYSELEQLIGIRTGITQLNQPQTSTTTGTSDTTNTSKTN